MIGKARLQLNNPGGFWGILIQIIILREIDEALRPACKPLWPIS